MTAENLRNRECGIERDGWKFWGGLSKEMGEESGELGFGKKDRERDREVWTAAKRKKIEGVTTEI